ncbi:MULTISPECIES: TetR/AcrR family transcriptional regulator [unclassified Brevibacterium]|uniref:TetR/AcrR family transcriptional regulator n=1 Tax=unclassified Brevibacterium TaxID=2614124 RepID=UPI001092D9B2|nr:TetR/AcrR family transcriptional regulator [Brevibacterium sp. S22]TGD31625.1 TetR/AcrR family transcriptional regulator [Brevibacterium sp. S22]
MATKTSQQIARDIERSFAEQGFAEQGVEALRAEADVSLRTLYKYFPSREAMIVGALEYRDRAYLAWYEGGPDDGAEHVLYLLRRLGDWLAEVANTGCLFSNALSEYPESAAVSDVVHTHKERLAKEFLSRLDRVRPGEDNQPLAEQLFMLHEGMTQNAQLWGRKRVAGTALAAARTILSAAGIESEADDEVNDSSVGDA